MPAAAVIPAPIAYIKVVAVKKPVVELWMRLQGPSNDVYFEEVSYLLTIQSAFNRVGRRVRTFTLRKLECLKQAFA